MEKLKRVKMTFTWPEVKKLTKQMKCQAWTNPMTDSLPPNFTHRLLSETQTETSTSDLSRML
jgi:hypothetical protein